MSANPNAPLLLSTTAVALLALGTTLSAHATDCAAPGSTGERRACAAAAEGVAQLRHFVQRTRMVYALSMQDFTSGLPPDQLAKYNDEVKRVKIAEAK